MLTKQKALGYQCAQEIVALCELETYGYDVVAAMLIAEDSRVRAAACRCTYVQLVWPLFKQLVSVTVHNGPHAFLTAIQCFIMIDPQLWLPECLAFVFRVMPYVNRQHMRRMMLQVCTIDMLDMCLP